MVATLKTALEIRAARERKGMTQRQLGEKIGRSESQVGTYEGSVAKMPMEMLFKIAEALEVRPEELITGKQVKENPGKWDAELRIYGLEDRKAVMTILAVNGYDVGQHKKKVSQTGKSVAYYIHATDREGNADTSK